MTYPTDLLTVNAFIIASGGTGGHASMLPALNELCTLQSVTAGHVTNLPALNAIAVGLGAAGGYVTNLAALNAISVAIGGTGGHVTTLAAWIEIAGIGFFSAELMAKLLFLWTGKFNGDNLLSDLDTSVITVTGKDFSTTYIPTTSSATFQLPNTSPYISADTDYIWFKTNAAIRSATVAELIGYDFSRTFIEYDSASPNHIRKIAIAKAGETFTESEIDQLHRYFKLSVFWSNSFNVYGQVKSNRTTGKSTWTAEPVYPAILDDGNTMFWFDFAQGITKDGSERVSQWNDISGNNRHLLQATDANKPIYTASGIEFDGSNDFMKADPFTFNNPQVFYIVFKWKTWTNGDVLYDGNTTGIGMIRQSSSTPQFQVAHSSGYIAGTEITTLANNTFGILRVITTSVQSKIRLNSETQKTGSWVTTNFGGLTLARRGANNDSYGNVVIKEFIARKIEDTAGNDTDIMNYLKNRYSL